MLSSHREIVLDTETTGLDPHKGHRIVEIAAVELIGRVRTGNYFHAYVNPNRDMPTEAYNIHGISGEFLKDKPQFSTIAKDFLDFAGSSTMIIHNAAFDILFINHELATLGITPISMNRVVDTLLMARKKFPGAPASLDALCKRFNISLKSRDKHGALIDSELLALVYTELMGGLQGKFDLQNTQEAIQPRNRPTFPQRNFPVNDKESLKNQQMLQKINNAIWDTLPAKNSE